MLTASGGFNLVMGSMLQRVAGSFILTLPAGPYSDFTAKIVSVQLDAQNQTDLPDGIRDTVGFSTIGGSITLAGKLAGTPPITVADLFNPDNAASPLYRKKVKGCPAVFGFGVRVNGTAAPETPAKLTGIVTSVDCDHATGQVTLGLVDLSGDWGSLPEIPAVVTAAPFNAGLTSEFPMDQVIRSVNGSRGSSWPATRAQCVLSIGMRSSVWPEVGGLLSAPVGPVFVPGSRGSAYVVLSSAGTYPEYSLASRVPVGPIYAEFDVTGVIAGPGTAQVEAFLTGAGDETLDIQVLNTGITVEVFDASHISHTATWSVAISSAAHNIAMSGTRSGTTFAGTLWLDGVSHAFSVTGLPTAGANDFYEQLWVFGSGSGATIEALQVTTEAAPTPSYPFTPAAVLDPSLNTLLVVPEIAAGTMAADALQTMAAAELGYARMDENGIYRFSNRQTIAAAPVSSTVTSLLSLRGLNTSQGASTEYNHIRVPYTEWNFGAATAVYVLQSNKLIPRNRTISWTQPLGDGVLAANVDATVVLLPNAHNPLDGGSYYRASRDRLGLNAHPGLTVTINQISSGTVQVTAVNGTGYDAYLTTPSSNSDFTAGAVGTGLWIGGIPVTPADEALVDVTINAADAVFSVTSNAYIQDHDTAIGVGQYLLEQLYASIRDFTDVAIVPDVRKQIADLLHIQDLVLSLIDEYVRVWGWSFSASFPPPGETGGSWDMTLNVRALGPPGAWLGGIAGRSEGGITTYGY